MSQILRQSTQVVVVIGPFVDVTDGFTPEVGVTLSGADEAEVLKANTTTTTDISGATWAAITGCDGWYGLTLTTTLTDTVGPLTVMVNDDSVCLPVLARFQVIEEAAYDALYAAAAPGPATPTNITAGTITTVSGNVNGSVGSVTGLTAANLDAAVSTRLATAGYTAPDNASIAAILVDTGTTLDAAVAAVKADTAAILVDTGTTGVVVDAASTRTAVGMASANLDTQLDALPTAAEVTTAVLTTAITESYAADGAAPTLAQALCQLLGRNYEFAISGDTLTVKKLDGQTTAMTFTLAPAGGPYTSITRAS